MQVQGEPVNWDLGSHGRTEGLEEHRLPVRRGRGGMAAPW